jgi:hypothetical protein
MMERKGIDPDRFLDRRENVAMLKKNFGINYSAGYLAKQANLGTGPGYQIVNGRALMRPREFLRYVFSRSSAVRRSPEVRRPRMKPNKGSQTRPPVAGADKEALARDEVSAPQSAT